MDSRGSLSPLRQYKKKGEITCLVYCSASLRSESPPLKSKSDSKAVAIGSSPSFFYGTDRGSVIYADDLGHCTDVQQLSSSIDSMMFFEQKSRLVIINRSLLLTQYHVAEDGKVSRVMQVKLSVPAEVMERGIRSVVWAGPGMLALATEEKIVRILDLASDESYNISMTGLLENMARNDRVCCVAFSPVDRYLAVGTQQGTVAVWKFNGVLRDLGASNKGTVASSASSDWEVVYFVLIVDYLY